jgi:glycosyltransferase involved in cell wall biosynthesis
MKIGIFTDTYRPSVNGVVYVTEILRRNFEALGHEVYIFAPASSLHAKKDTPDDHIIRFPALPGMISDEGTTPLFFPPKVLKQIKELNFDMFHFLVPGPIGLMAMYAAKKLDKPVVAEYCTDYFQYVEHYPAAIPGIIALGFALPFTFKVSRGDLLSMLKAGRPRINSGDWSREAVKNLLTVIHSHCDAVIVHSRKSEHQLKSWQEGDSYPMHIIPTGIDPAPAPTAKRLAELTKKWQITPQTDVVLYLGRLSAEKNLDLLVGMMAELIKWRPQAKLVFVGDFDYREKLEAHAKASPAADHIVFAGKIAHEEIGAAYALAKVFAFPSTTDTQSLTLHEAALAGLPVVMVDEPVTEVVKDGVNGYFAENNPVDMAAKIRKILEDPKLQKKMGAASRKIAAAFSERTQTKKIVAIYGAILKAREARL